MKFPFFASFIVLIIWVKYEIGKANRKKHNSDHDFWEKEHAANNVRKKSLNNLHYIEIPYDLLPTNLLGDDQNIQNAVHTINSLQDQKIVNLTGISNTDLKLTYGTANLTVLSEYDQNYTLLTTALYSWASTLYENGYQKEAVPILEFGIMTGTDISGYYRLLYNYYLDHGNKEKIDWLRQTAENLDSAMKNTIIRLLLGDGQTA